MAPKSALLFREDIGFLIGIIEPVSYHLIGSLAARTTREIALQLLHSVLSLFLCSTLIVKSFHSCGTSPDIQTAERMPSKWHRVSIASPSVQASGFQQVNHPEPSLCQTVPLLYQFGVGNNKYTMCVFPSSRSTIKKFVIELGGNIFGADRQQCICQISPQYTVAVSFILEFMRPLQV